MSTPVSVDREIGNALDAFETGQNLDAAQAEQYVKTVQLGIASADAKVKALGLLSIAQLREIEANGYEYLDRRGVKHTGPLSALGKQFVVQVEQQIANADAAADTPNAAKDKIKSGTASLAEITSNFQALRGQLEYDNLNGDQAAKLLDQIGVQTGDNIEESRKKIADYLKTLGPNIKVDQVQRILQGWLDVQKNLIALKSAMPQADAAILDGQIKSLPLADIGKLHDFYKDVVGLDENGKPARTLLETARDDRAKFQSGYGLLPAPLQEAVKKSLGDQAEIYLKPLEVAGKTAQLDAQTLKYLAAVQPRLLAAGIKTSEDLVNGMKDGRIQNIINTQTGSDGNPISEEVRMKLMEDFGRQMGNVQAGLQFDLTQQQLKLNRAQTISAEAEASNAVEMAQITKYGLDMAKGLFNGGGINGLGGGLTLGGVMGEMSGGGFQGDDRMAGLTRDLQRVSDNGGQGLGTVLKNYGIPDADRVAEADPAAAAAKTKPLHPGPANPEVAPS